MIWWIIGAIIFVIIIGLEIFFGVQIKVPRQPGKEGADTAESLVAYDRIGNWRVFKYERKIVLRELAKYRLSGTMVDVGCGPGYLAAVISLGSPELKVTGVDINPGMLTIAKRNWSPDHYPNLKFIEGDAGHLPLTDESVDWVVSSLALHHFPDAGAALKEMHRVLKPGGHFLIFDLRRNPLRGFYYIMILGQLFAPGAIRGLNGATGSILASYTPVEVKEMLEKENWKSTGIKSNFGWMIVNGEK